MVTASKAQTWNCRCRRPGAGSDDPLGTCTMIKKRRKGKAPNRSSLRDAAMKHLEDMKGATRYPLERNAGGGYLCMINDRYDRG